MDPLSSTKDSDRRQATVLFADIAGFTALSQSLDPEEVTETMNACFRAIEQVVVEHGGTVDKFIGDCVMALFGAPFALEEAPKLAVNAAIEIRSRLQRTLEERALGGKLNVHIAINTGLVVAGAMGGEVQRHYTVMGPAVNLASRLLSTARPGQIVVGSATHRFTRRDFEYRATKPLKLKGIDGPTVAYELLSTDPRPHRARPGDRVGGVVSAMVDRTCELGVLQERVAALREGRGGVITVAAEIGMGKSRLLAELRRLEAHGVTLLEGRSLSLGRALSFHPFVDLLRAWAGVESGMGVAQEQRRFRDAVVAACGDGAAEILPFLKTMMGWDLEASERARVEGLSGHALERLVRKAVRKLVECIAQATPTVLIFEDLHWADESSVRLLETLLPAVEHYPILVIAALRTGQGAIADRIAADVDRRFAARHVRLDLQPLHRRDCDALIANVLGTEELRPPLFSLVLQRTEGNPFFIEEVLRSFVDVGALVRDKNRLVATAKLEDVEVPGSIEEVVMSRVDRLEEPTRQTLQIASVLGRRFERRILEMLAPEGLDPGAELPRLVARELLLEESPAPRARGDREAAPQPDEETYAFKHTLIQETVYASILRKSRRVLHERCARAYEEAFGGRLQDAYALLAYHWMHAERLDKAEEYLFKAGEQAARTAASAEALQLFRDAYRAYLSIHGGKADPAKKALLEKNIGFALLNTGKLVDCVEPLNAALRLYGEWVPQTRFGLHCKLAVDLPVVLFRLYWPAGSRARRERPHDVDVYQTMYNRARAQNPTDPVRNFFDNFSSMRHLHRVDPERVEHAVGMYAANGAFCAFAAPFGRWSLTIGRRFLSVAQGLVRPERVIDNVEFQAMASVFDFHAGDWAGTHDMNDELLEEALRAGLLWDADVYLCFTCERDLRQGKFAAAEHALSKLQHVIHSYGYDFSQSTLGAMTANLLLEKRALREAHEAMQAYYDARHEDTLRVYGLSGLARIEVLEHRLDAAVEALDRAQQIVRRAPRLPPFYCAAYWVSRLHVDLALLDERKVSRRQAARTARQALAVVRHIARDRPECYRLVARLHWRTGDLVRARKWWGRALDEGSALGARPELARTHADIAAALPDDRSDPEFRGRTASEWLAEAHAQYEALGLPA